MSTSKLRALISSSYNNIGAALCDMVWANNPSAVEDLQNAQELLGMALDELPDEDDPEELDF